MTLLQVYFKGGSLPRGVLTGGSSGTMAFIIFASGIGIFGSGSMPIG